MELFLNTAFKLKKSVNKMGGQLTAHFVYRYK